MKVNRQFILLLLSSVALLSLVIILTNFSGLKNKEGRDVAKINPEKTQEIQNQPVPVVFESQGLTLTNREELNFFVEFEELPDSVPTAYTIQLLFDPELMSVQQIELGDLWTDANILQNNIDNEEGVVLFSAGRGFDAEETGGKRLLDVSVIANRKAVGNLETIVELGPESQYVLVGVDRLIDLSAQPITFELSDE